MFDRLSTSLLLCVISICAVWIAIYVVLSIVVKVVPQLYWHLQISLIKSSHLKPELWRCINRKLLIINYRMYRKVFPFLKGLVSASHECKDHDRYLELRIISPKWKNIISGFVCSCIIAVLLHCALKYWFQITDTAKKIISWGHDAAIFEFITTNWIAILAILAIILLFARYLKDKYINSVIYQIHDEELKRILNVHKSLFRDIASLRDRLSFNLEIILKKQKRNGKLLSLCRVVENACPQFSYNQTTKSFELRPENYGFSPVCLSAEYKEIAEQLARINTAVADFWNTSPYYSTSAVNKYVRGLAGFDISSFSKRYSVRDIICREYIELACSQFSESLNNIIRNEYPTEAKIGKLNKLLSEQSEMILIAIEDTVCLAIEIDEYIKHFNKAFRLKTRRREFPIDEISDKIK